MAFVRCPPFIWHRGILRRAYHSATVHPQWNVDTRCRLLKGFENVLSSDLDGLKSKTQIFTALTADSRPRKTRALSSNRDVASGGSGRVCAAARAEAYAKSATLLVNSTSNAQSRGDGALEPNRRGRTGRHRAPQLQRETCTMSVIPPFLLSPVRLFLGCVRFLFVFFRPSTTST